MTETPPLTKKTDVNSSTKTSLTPCRRVGLGRPSSASLKKTLLVRTVSTPPLKDVIHNSEAVSSESQPIENVEDQLKVPLKSSDILNKKCGPSVRRCLTTGPKPPSQQAKRTFSNNEGEVCTTDNHSKHVNERHQYENSNLDKKRKLNIKLIVNCPKEFEEKLCVSENVPGSSTGAVSQQICIDMYAHDKTQQVTSEIIHNLVLSVTEKKKKLEQLRVQETYAKKHDLVELRSQTAKWATAGREALRYSISLARHAGYSVTLKQLLSQHGFPSQLMGYNEEDDEFD